MAPGGVWCFTQMENLARAWQILCSIFSGLGFVFLPDQGEICRVKGLACSKAWNCSMAQNAHSIS